jgi:beta-glucosidase
LAIPQVQEKAAAILEAWFPGTQGASGVADVLFGDIDPAGRLTATFPRNVGQVPFHYNHFNTGRPGIGDYHGTYVDVPTTPLYPFGFGLAYTTFEFGKVELETNRVTPIGKVTATVKIKNTGSRPGTAVAELYLRALAASAGSRPVRELKGFQKILLAPGESKVVSFTLAAKELGYFDAKGNWLVEPGKYQVWISADSASGEPVAFELAK